MPARNNRILVIDDDPEIWKAYQAILAHPRKSNSSSSEKMARLLGTITTDDVNEWPEFQLSFKSQGQDGYQLVHEVLTKGLPFAVAFIDIRMPPGWNGVETAAKIRKIDPNIEIVIITAYSDCSRSEIVRTVGRPDKLLFLRKPFDPEELSQITLSLTEKWNLIQIQERQKKDILTSEKRFRDLVETTKDWVWETDSTGRITYCSPISEKIYGYQPEELIGENFFDTLIPETDRNGVMSHFAEHIRSSSNFYAYERHGQRKDGKIIYVETSGVPVLNDSGLVIGFRGIERDITDRKLAEKILIHARDSAEAASRIKSEFLANMSHEIRTPMNGIIGMTELLLDSDLSPEQRDHIRNISISAESLLTIVNDILDFSKIEAGKMTTESIPFDLRLIVDGVAEQLSIKAEKKGLKYVVRYDPTTPCRVLGDSGRVRQILTNLADNAIKFTNQGQILINVECESNLNRNYVKFSVQDSGIGIRSDKLDHIFEMFTQADSSTTRQYGGTGLGLAISKQLTNLLGGSIGVKSSPDKGSTFWFSLPLPAVHETFTSPEIPKELSGLRVLIVDDNELSRNVLQEQLSNWAIRNKAVESVEKMLETLHTAWAVGDPFHVTILGQNSPEKDAGFFGHKLKQDPALSCTSFITLASQSQQKNDSCSPITGFSACLLKPVSQSQLMNALATVWNNSHAQSRSEDCKSDDFGIPAKTPLPVLPATKDVADPVNAKILLAEDNLINQKVSMLLLKRMGFMVDVASNGREALDKIKKTTYDLIIMDCQMPEMDGYQATAAIRKLPDPFRNIPIIALTANAMQGDREKCLEAGMDDYLSKPVKAADLEKMIRHWLSHKSRTN